MSYAEQYKNPRWQRKRLEVMERDGFACRHCKDKTRTLNVHHCFYEKGASVWDYNSETLVTLCEGCHERFHRVLKALSLNAIEWGFMDALQKLISHRELPGFVWQIRSLGDMIELAKKQGVEEADYAATNA